MQKIQFNVYKEAREIHNPYGLIEGDLARTVLSDFEKVREEKFPGLDSLKGILSVKETEQSPECVLAGSNFPVLSVLNSHDFPLEECYGFRPGNPQQLARMYNDEVERVINGTKPFIKDNFWYDVQLIRNPAGRNLELKPWEHLLDEGLSAIAGRDEILAVPYSVIKISSMTSDNGLFGKTNSYAVIPAPGAEKLVKVVKWTTEQSKGFKFGRFNEETGVPEINSPSDKFSRQFCGLQQKLFSRLCVNGDLNASCGVYLAYSDEFARVVGFSTG